MGSLCYSYLAAYMRHMHEQEHMTTGGQGADATTAAVTRRQLRRAKKQHVVYDDDEAGRVLFRYPMEEHAVVGAPSRVWRA